MSSDRGGEITERMIGTCWGSTLSLVLISIKVGGAETHDDIRAAVHVYVYVKCTYAVCVFWVKLCSLILTYNIKKYGFDLCHMPLWQLVLLFPISSLVKTPNTSLSNPSFPSSMSYPSSIFFFFYLLLLCISVYLSPFFICLFQKYATSSIHNNMSLSTHDELHKNKWQDFFHMYVQRCILITLYIIIPWFKKSKPSSSFLDQKKKIT